MPTRAFIRFFILPVAALALSSMVRADTTPDGIPAITKPSQDVILSFVRPGRVVEILVKEGEHVEKGQLLARQDDSEESKALALYKSKAEDMTQIDAQKFIEQQSAKDAENLKKSGAGSQYEKDHAVLQDKVDAAKIKIAESQHEQDVDQYEQNLAIVEKTKLYAPISGLVEELLVHQGESVDTQNMKVMRLVNIDPMWVEVPVPFSQAQELKDGDVAQIRLSNRAILAGKVIHVASVAESASDTLLVRVEVANPEHRKLGERVNVSFNAKVASAGQP
ncbi:MAG TPA: efflux RND transporter periplasmic adaptor subunit [Phycisphaerae bacterium]|nr:efflux RND transporter periplasmic adaptor subunit [Phycisphaerae bacterium]